MTYTKYGPTVCSNHLMRESIIDDYVIGDLKSIAAKVLDDDYYKEFEGMNVKQESNEDSRIDEITRKLNEVKEIIKGLYLDKVKGIIDEDLFLSMSGEYSEEKERLSREYTKLIDRRKAARNPQETVDYMSIIRQISNFDIVDKTLLFKLIDRIELSADREIHITYKFKNPYDMRVSGTN